MNGTKVSVYWHDSAWVVKDTNGKTEHRDTAILRDVTFNYNGTVCAGEAILKLDATGLIAMAQKLPDLILPIVFKLT